MKEMSNAETAKHLREYIARPNPPFSWPTDGCGYKQHIRFVEHRNKNWHGGNQEDFKKFVLDYANSLERLRVKELSGGLTMKKPKKKIVWQNWDDWSDMEPQDSDTGDDTDGDLDSMLGCVGED